MDPESGDFYVTDNPFAAYGAGVFCVVGGAWAVWKAFEGYRGARKMIREGLTAEGRAIKDLRRRGENGDIHHLPVIKFTDQDGRKRTFRSSLQFSKPQSGQEFLVRYLPDAPAGTAEIHSWRARWANTLGLAFCGLAFVAAGVTLVVSYVVVYG
ncbi:DUF3592 domain-containing protein [Streptomyces sp. NBC_01525]|uniref:DUF3592 domain-containing protein n=1 Tax=Streptomyces sp. NBC_01525 TaxID=2903893 RepID=UPI00386F5B9B